MRSLSSTVSEMASSCAPSRRVVSYISTRSGVLFAGIFQPLFVLRDLAVDGGEIGLLDLAGDLPRLADLAVVHRPHRDDLGRGAGEERFLGAVEVGPQQVVLPHRVPEVAGDSRLRVKLYALQH